MSFPDPPKIVPEKSSMLAKSWLLPRANLEFMTSANKETVSLPSPALISRFCDELVTSILSRSPSPSTNVLSVSIERCLLR